MASTLQAILNDFTELKDDEKDIFLDITKNRMIEDRRNEIKRNAEKTKEAIITKRAKFGNVNDLMADLEN